MTSTNFNGNRVQVQYFFPDLSSNIDLVPVEQTILTVDFGIEAIGSGDFSGPVSGQSFDIGGTYLRYIASQAANWLEADFNGVVVEDIDNSLAPIVDARVVRSDMGFTQDRLTFTEDAIFINNQDLSQSTGDETLIEVFFEPINTVRIEPVSSVFPEGDSGTSAAVFEVIRQGDLSGFDTVEFAVVGTGATPADARDFVAGSVQTVTTEATTTIQSTGQDLSVSLTLPEGTMATSTGAFGFVSSGDVAEPPINIAYVYDVSGSTFDVFPGTSPVFVGDEPVGDVNGDGDANEILDAEIAALEVLNERIIAADFDSNINIGIIPFSGESAVVSVGTPGADIDRNGRPDIADILRDTVPGSPNVFVGGVAIARNGADDGGTDFNDALEQALTFLRSQDPFGLEDNFVFFLSDGEDNGNNSFADEVAALIDPNGLNATIRAIGVGANANEAELDLVDDGIRNFSAQVITDPDDLTPQLSRSPVSAADVDRVELFRNGVLVETIPASALVSTPLGLRYEVEIVGLNPGSADVIEARVVASDPAATAVATSQILEATEEQDVLPSGSLTFTPGQERIAFPIGIRGDTDPEADETYEVVLSNPSAGTGIGEARAPGTILNDDPSGVTINALDADRGEGDAGVTRFLFEVVRTGVATGPLAVNFRVESSGTSPATVSDFGGSTLPSGTVFVAEGARSQVFSVEVRGDTLVESDETFTMRLTGVSGDAEIRTPTAEVVIRNDDAVTTSALPAELAPDIAATPAGVSRSIDVLANDVSGSGLPLTILGVGPTEAGGSTLITGDAIFYTPPPGFQGIDRFTYDAGDFQNDTSSADVIVVVGQLPPAERSNGVLRGTDQADLMAIGQGAIYLGRGGEDTYIVSGGARPGTSVIEDTGETVQFVDGLEIADALFFGDAVQFRLTNGSVIQVLDASSTIFEVGGNATTGDEGSTYSLEGLAQEIFGVSLSGGVASGGPVIIEDPADAVL